MNVCASSASALNAAELPPLPLLYPPRSRGWFVSRNAVKSEVNSIYRKLWASSRSEAVARAGDLGLLDWQGSPGGALSSSWDDAAAGRRGDRKESRTGLE